MTTPRKKQRRDKKRAQYRAAAKARSTRPQASPARNVQKEPGRPIAVRDVAPYARAGCQKCQGKGMVGYRKVGETRGAEPCKCATTRFWKAHPEIIVTDKGVAFWPADEAPEQIAALKAARASLKDGPARDALDLMERETPRPVLVEAPFTTDDIRAATAVLERNRLDVVHVEIAPGSPLAELAAEQQLAQVMAGITPADAAAAGKTVHHLHHGQTACPFGRDFDVPASWPPGHLWTAIPEQVNCQGCLDILAVRETFAKEEATRG